MTNFDIFAKIISEASGKPLEEVRQMSDVILKMVGSSQKMYVVVPDSEAERLLTQLRSELPGIRNWLIQGGLMAEANIAKREGKIN